MEPKLWLLVNGEYSKTGPAVTWVLFYWDQPFQPQPVWVDMVDVSQYNTFSNVFV